MLYIVHKLGHHSIYVSIHFVQLSRNSIWDVEVVEVAGAPLAVDVEPEVICMIISRKLHVEADRSLRCEHCWSCLSIRRVCPRIGIAVNKSTSFVCTIGVENII